ncbi:MAG: metallophosphoesterase [Verrucomicrobiaceae bacterium]|nr:MAG: metallophosphoesterase [Verrucomicrobiaceae bacterium]
MFIVVVLSLLLLLDLFWAFGVCWLLRRSVLRQRWRLITLTFVALQVLGLCVMVSMRLGAAQPANLGLKAEISAVFIWHLLLLPLGVSLLWLGLGGWSLFQLGARLRRPLQRRGMQASSTAESIPRREFLGASLALVPPLFTMASTGVAITQLRNFRRNEFTLELPHLPPALDGLTIAHLSDLHVGPFTSGRVLDDVVQATNDLGADVIVFTGDLINTSLSDLPEAIRLLHRLKATHGLFLIEGNHDLIDDGEEFVRRIRAEGINLLLNEAATIPVAGAALQLLGLRWGSPQRTKSRAHEKGDEAIAASLEQLLVSRDPNAFAVLLAHHPHAFDAAAAAGIPLTLAGHTHGGQLMANNEVGFGPVMFRYWSGLYTRGQNHLIVSNGVGNWFPLRVQAPAEIVHITLKRRS